MLTRRRFLGGSASLGVWALGCRARVHDADVREIDRFVAGTRTRDGAGVALRRTVGGAELPDLDSFLLTARPSSTRPSPTIATAGSSTKMPP